MSDRRHTVRTGPFITGLYRDRWQWAAPCHVSDWWLPRVGLSTDEYCNPSIYAIIPPLGMIVVFYRPGRLHTAADAPCARCLVDDERARRAGWTVVRP